MLIPLHRFEDPAFLEGALFATYIFCALLFVIVVILCIHALRERVVTGHEEILSARGKVTSWSHNTGEVHVTGEIWQARSADDSPLSKGDSVRIVNRDGLTLVVEKIKEN